MRGLIDCRAPLKIYRRCPARLGEVAEWSNVPDSKSGVGASLPWVRIPPSPPESCFTPSDAVHETRDYPCDTRVFCFMLYFPGYCNQGVSGGGITAQLPPELKPTPRGDSMKLTDTAVRKAKPEAKPYKMADGGGLFLLVQPNGGKWWRSSIALAERKSCWH